MLTCSQSVRTTSCACSSLSVRPAACDKERQRTDERRRETKRASWLGELRVIHGVGCVFLTVLEMVKLHTGPAGCPAWI